MAEKKPSFGKIEKYTGPDQLHEVYEVIQAAIARWHPELAMANYIALWSYQWKPDKDGHMRLAQFVLFGERDWLLHGYDFMLLVNYNAWTKGLDYNQKLALMDHELCHGGVDADQDGNVSMDAHGRLAYRTKKHDLEEFHGVVARHGLWLPDLKEMARAMADSDDRPLLAAMAGHAEELAGMQPAEVIDKKAG